MSIEPSAPDVGGPELPPDAHIHTPRDVRPTEDSLLAEIAELKARLAGPTETPQGAELPPGCTWGDTEGDVRGVVLWGNDVVATGHTREQAANTAWDNCDGITREEWARLQGVDAGLSAAEVSLGELELLLGDALEKVLAERARADKAEAALAEARAEVQKMVVAERKSNAFLEKLVKSGCDWHTKADAFEKEAAALQKRAAELEGELSEAFVAELEAVMVNVTGEPTRTERAEAELAAERAAHAETRVQLDDARRAILNAESRQDALLSVCTALEVEIK